MFKAKLDEFLARVLDVVMRVAAALWAMAAHNPRTTGAGVAGAVVLVGGRYGLELTPDQQLNLSVGVAVLLGLLAGDQLKRGIR